jgi:hypothetical protein
VLLLIAVGARWIRAFFTEMLARLPAKTMILDWYDLHQKCTEQCSRICRGKQAKRQLLLRLYRRLWRGVYRAHPYPAALRYNIGARQCARPRDTATDCRGFHTADASLPTLHFADQPGSVCCRRPSRSIVAWLLSLPLAKHIDRLASRSDALNPWRRTSDTATRCAAHDDAYVKNLAYYYGCTLGLSVASPSSCAALKRR